MTIDLFDLSGRVAIVTGAGSGIGRASAEVLAAAGAAVVCADRDGDNAQETALRIEKNGGKARSKAVDVSQRAAVRELVQSTEADLGPVDIICNIAGIIHDAPVLEIDERDLDRVLAVNLKGVLFGCQEAGAVMVPRRRGSIINMASGAIDAAPPNLVAYNIAKAGVVQITRTLAREVAPHNVRVNSIAPGFVETGITRRHYVQADGSIDETRRAALLEGTRTSTPLGVLGTPEDIAYAVLYLASDAAKFMTGQTLRPNGGSSMPW